MAMHDTKVACFLNLHDKKYIVRQINASSDYLRWAEFSKETFLDLISSDNDQIYLESGIVSA